MHPGWTNGRCLTFRALVGAWFGTWCAAVLGAGWADPGTQLSIAVSNEHLVLNYQVSAPHAGTVRIRKADHLQELPDAPPVWTEPIPEGGTGTVVFPDGFGEAAAYYLLSWDAEVSNPQPDQLVWVPPGSLDMGSFFEEVGHEPDEAPVTRVTLARGFFLGRCEVSQADYVALMTNNPSASTLDLRQPVEQVSWPEASEYCVRLTETESAAGRLPEGFIYRLPTEAEWEYAARAGSSSRFSFGDDPDYSELSAHAWFSDNAGDSPHPVGEKLPNAWGLCDLYGNVAEWCLDWYGPYPGGSVTDPRGFEFGDDHVIRGGSYPDQGEFCRSAFRLIDWTADRFSNVGFRVVLAPNVPPPVAPQSLVWIPAGSFEMGSPASDPDQDRDESPQTTIVLRQGFWMGRYEVTQQQFAELMGSNPSYYPGLPYRPVEQVTWEEAVEFCDRLTVCEKGAGRLPNGYAYRLPTEAEWEYVARAGNGSRFSFGDDPDYTNLVSVAHFLVGPTEGVGARQPNPWGIYGLEGNVAEWCHDWHAPYVGGPRSDPIGPAMGHWRVNRGGAIDAPEEYCRAAARGGGWPDARYRGIGFRVVLARAIVQP